MLRRSVCIFSIVMSNEMWLDMFISTICLISGRLFVACFVIDCMFLCYLLCTCKHFSVSKLIIQGNDAISISGTLACFSAISYSSGILLLSRYRCVFLHTCVPTLQGPGVWFSRAEVYITRVSLLWKQQL